MNLAPYRLAMSTVTAILERAVDGVGGRGVWTHQITLAWT